MNFNIGKLNLNSEDNLKIKFTTLNIEHPYFQLQDEACRKHDCPRVTQWQDPKACKHESNSKDYNSIIKNWEKRDCRIIDILKNSHIVCLQEVDLTILQLITKKLPQFQIIIPYGSSLHFTAILYDLEIFESLERPSKLSFACASLKHKVTKKIIDICSVHLTGYDFSNNKGIEKGNEELTTVTNEMFFYKKNASISVIAGDFNAPPESYRIQEIMKNYQECGGCQNEFLEKEKAEKENRYPNFTNYNSYTKKHEKIDYIFIKALDPKLTCSHKDEIFDYLPKTEEPEILNNKKKNRKEIRKFIFNRPTDHYPVSMEIILEN